MVLIELVNARSEGNGSSYSERIRMKDRTKAVPDVLSLMFVEGANSIGAARIASSEKEECRTKERSHSTYTFI